MPAETGEGSKGTLVTPAWRDLHYHQKQEEDKGAHGAIPLSDKIRHSLTDHHRRDS
jgi:hypothetical protein